MAILGLYKTKKQRTAERTAMIDADEKKIDRIQRVYGQEMETALSNAAGRNKVFNVLKGTASAGVGLPYAGHIVNDGGSYYIAVQAEERGIRSVPIVEVSIDIRRNRIHTHYGAYDADNNYTLADFDRVKDVLVKDVETARLFRE